jgi:hypothetical protein
MIEGDAKRVTIYIGEWDKWHHQSLHTAIVELLRREGCAGATVLKGVEGFGKDSRIHTSGVLRLSQDLPVVVEFVDTAERVDHVLPMIEKMVQGGLITIEDVHVLRYSGSEREG